MRREVPNNWRLKSRVRDNLSREELNDDRRKRCRGGRRRKKEEEGRRVKRRE
jgi:hypothetical protein